MRVVWMLILVLLAIPAAAAPLIFLTTAEEDAALAIATEQFNASRPDRPALTAEEYFREYVRSMLGSLQIRVQYQQERRKADRWESLPLAERQRILNQIECSRNTC